MILNYLKGSSACVLSAIFTFFLISVLFDSGYGLDSAFAEFYSYLTVATIIGLIGGLLAISILRLYPNEDLFSKDPLAIFAVAGFAVGTLLDLLYGLAIVPTFMLSGVAGSLAFLAVQKINNKVMGWSIVALHVGLLFIYPPVIDFISSNWQEKNFVFSLCQAPMMRQSFYFSRFYKNSSKAFDFH